MINRYHTSLLLTAITHCGCMHSQKLGMSTTNPQEPAEAPIAALVESIAPEIMFKYAESLTQRALACSGLALIAAEDLPQRAIAFAKMMDESAYKMAFGNNHGNDNINPMYQDVIDNFPELLITSPVAALPEPEPTNETAEAIRMYPIYDSAFR